MMLSHASFSRQVAAGIVIASGAAYVAAVKLTRDGGTHLATAWVAGVLPNFVCGAVVPLAVFLTQRSLRFREFLWMTLFTLIGLCVYEVAQLGMPRRTFDWDDILASIAGAIMALVLGTGFFIANWRQNRRTAGSA